MSGTQPERVSERHIHSHFGPRPVADLLQAVFGAELLSPSDRIWLVSPWISDIPVLDNRAGAFTSLVADWAPTWIRLSTVLGWLLRRDTRVLVATRPAEHNREFFRQLRQQSVGNDAGLTLREGENLHGKGILGDRYYLSGSMNLTVNGITFNDETLHFFTDPGVVAENRRMFSAWWDEAERL